MDIGSDRQSHEVVVRLDVEDAYRWADALSATSRRDAHRLAAAASRLACICRTIRLDACTARSHPHIKDTA